MEAVSRWTACDLVRPEPHVQSEAGHCRKRDYSSGVVPIDHTIRPKCGKST
ncbi:hypothetical protein M3J09_001587 [Ascochyta lentis]